MGLGADGTPTERLDRAAERALFAVMAQLGLEWDVFSEECGFVPHKRILALGADACTGGMGTEDRSFQQDGIPSDPAGEDRAPLLVVDPVDGTLNASRRIPIYTTSLALVPPGGTLRDVESGIVLNLATGNLYVAQRGEGAWVWRRAWEEGPERIRTRPYREGDAMATVYFGRGRDRSGDRAETARRLCGGCKRTRSLGCASLELCLVAAGSFDLFVQTQPLRITDIAAGALIVWEAGGELYDTGLSPLEMRVSLDRVDRRGVVALGDPSALDGFRKRTGG